MRRHWQKRPLLIRGAVDLANPLLTRSQLFALAAQDEVESRLIVKTEADWRLSHGPLPRRALPKVEQPGWTVLVQGLDLHLPAAHELISQFRFVPDARLDDLMVSWASDGGGVGPHVDSYDVFLLQVQGRRRWRIGRVSDTRLVPDLPLKVLQHFEPEHEWLLEPGDMLYLPPAWGHDGVAEGECMTASIGFRSPGRAELCNAVLQRMLDASDAPETDALYRDPKQPATAEPGRIPDALGAFVRDEIARWLNEPGALDCALGELLSEPKPQVWFEPGEELEDGRGIDLHRRTRMVYDERHVFINGESFRASGTDFRLMRRLSDERTLNAAQVARLSAGAKELLDQWAEAGWLQAQA